MGRHRIPGNASPACSHATQISPPQPIPISPVGFATGKKAGGQASPAITTAWFEALGRRPHLPDWQLRQALRAVELWCREIARCGWAGSFPWDCLRAPSRQLESSHRTLLREAIPIHENARGIHAQDRREIPGEQAAVDDLLNRARRAIRLAGLAVATDQTYLDWTRRFTRFRRLGTSGDDLRPEAAAACLEYLALERQVSPATQRQALNAIVFLLRKVHEVADFGITFTPASKGSRHPPTVLSRDEVKRFFPRLQIHGASFASSFTAADCAK